MTLTIETLRQAHAEIATRDGPDATPRIERYRARGNSVPDQVAGLRILAAAEPENCNAILARVWELGNGCR